MVARNARPVRWSMRIAARKPHGAFVAAVALVLVLTAQTAYAGSNGKAYKLTGRVQPSQANAFSGRPTARVATAGAQPVSLVDPDYYILSADPTTGAYMVGLEAIARVPVALVEVADDPATNEQLIAVGRPSADGQSWYEAQLAVGDATSSTSAAGGVAIAGQIDSSASIIGATAAAYVATHGFFSTFWMDPFGITVNSVIDEAHWSYNGSTVANLTGNDSRQWLSGNGWAEISHSIGAYYNGAHTVGTVWTNDNFRTSSWFPVPWCGTSNTYYQANNAYGFADGHIGGGVNTWATSGCLPFLSYTAFASPGS